MNDAVYFEKCDRVFYEDRLKTFENWPKQMTPDKYSLARAGFYYTGEGDKVTCFACKLSLGHWERDDEALIEHNKWSANCAYLKIVGTQPLDVVDKTKSVPIFGGKPVQFGTTATTFSTTTTKQSNTAPNFGFGSSVQTTPNFGFGTTPANYFIKRTPTD